jgi:hypothetical protein
MGNALPCVLCRKSLEKYKIKWVACVGEENWVSSMNPETLPKSKPTHKQRRVLKFTD